MNSIKFDLNKDLHDRISAAARTSGKSLNAEVADRLEASFVASEPAAMLRTAVRILKQQVIEKDQQIEALTKNVEALRQLQSLYVSLIQDFCKMLPDIGPDEGKELRNFAIEAISLSLRERNPSDVAAT